MTFSEFTNLLKATAVVDKDFNNLYKEIAESVESLGAEDIGESFKIETQDFDYLFYVNLNTLEKNQKQTMFLISKFNKDRSFLLFSFRLDVEVEDIVNLTLTKWKQTQGDYITKVRNIVLNKQEFIL